VVPRLVWAVERAAVWAKERARGTPRRDKHGGTNGWRFVEVFKRSSLQSTVGF